MRVYHTGPLCLQCLDEDYRADTRHTAATALDHLLSSGAHLPRLRGGSFQEPPRPAVHPVHLSCKD